MLSQKKETKEKATPYRLFPVLPTITSVNRNSRCSDSRLPKTPMMACNIGAIAGDLKSG
ncbi:MAG: hypothetical protein ABIP37_04290 [Methylotenera sp.]